MPARQQYLLEALSGCALAEAGDLAMLTPGLVAHNPPVALAVRVVMFSSCYSPLTSFQTMAGADGQRAACNTVGAAFDAAAASAAQRAQRGGRGTACSGSGIAARISAGVCPGMFGCVRSRTGALVVGCVHCASPSPCMCAGRPANTTRPTCVRVFAKPAAGPITGRGRRASGTGKLLHRVCTHARGR